MDKIYCPKCKNKNGLIAITGTVPCIGTFDCYKQEMVALQLVKNELDFSATEMHTCKMCGHKFDMLDVEEVEE